MENKNIVSSKILEIETSIKLLEYLKRNDTIDDGMYNFCVDKLVNRIDLEKNKINNDYIKNVDNYKILT